MGGRRLPTSTQKQKICVSDSAVLEALYQSLGNIHRAAKALNIDRTGIIKRLDKNPHLRQAFENIKEDCLDRVEQMLSSHIFGVPKKDANGETTGWLIKPDLNATTFYLCCQGRHRGWSMAYKSSSQQDENTGEQKQNTTIIFKDKNDTDITKLIKDSRENYKHPKETGEGLFYSGSATTDINKNRDTTQETNELLGEDKEQSA